METEEILDEIEFSFSLLERPIFKVRLICLSFKKGSFCGIWARYKSELSSKKIDVFIPCNELKEPYFFRSVAKKLVRQHTTIEVYPLRIDPDKDNCNMKKWQIPIFTMFSSDQRIAAGIEAEETKLTDPSVEEINIKKGSIFEKKDFKLRVISVEYHQDNERPKSVAFRITAPSKYPIIRQDQELEDLDKWEKLQEHSRRGSSSRVRRFFYKENGRNKMEIGRNEITLLPFFSRKERKEMHAKGYVGKLRIVCPQEVL